MEYFNTIDHTADVNLLFTGREACRPGKVCSGVRSHILLHYVLQGSGYAGPSGAPLSLSRGALFCFFPDQPHYYRSTRDDPWEYVWVGFTGSRAAALLESCGFSPDKPVQSPPFSFMLQQLFEQLHSAQQKREEGYGILSDGILLQMLGHIQSLSSGRSKGPAGLTKTEYVQALKQFMLTNFQKPISVSQVTAYSGLERSYCSRLFKSVTGMTIQEYLSALRMNRARMLLASGKLSVTDIAYSVGYRQYASFERCFRRTHGMAPGRFQEEII